MDRYDYTRRLNDYYVQLGAAEERVANLRLTKAERAFLLDTKGADITDHYWMIANESECVLMSAASALLWSSET